MLKISKIYLGKLLKYGIYKHIAVTKCHEHFKLTNLRICALIHCADKILPSKAYHTFCSNFQSESEDEENEASDEQTEIAKHLRFNCETKSSNYQGQKVEYFKGKASKLNLYSLIGINVVSFLNVTRTI